MIIGVGTDAIEIERVRKASEKKAFLIRVFTGEERRQAGDRITMLAGDFAVKEAVSKAFGTGFRGFGPGDIEVLRDDLGKPYVKLSEKALAVSRERGISHTEVSITNTAELAIAFAVAEGERI